MLLRSRHRYLAEASRPDGRRLGEFEIRPDFAPAAEWSHLHGVRRGALAPSAHHGPGVVEPVFDADGPPRVAGVRVRFDGAPGGLDGPVVPHACFRASVEAGAARLVRDGRIEPYERLEFRIHAVPATGGERRAAQAHPAAPAMRLGARALAPLAAAAQRVGEGAWSDVDYPVFVRAEVLDEALALAGASGERETGGILVGHLHRDTASSELHAEITAQIPATQARAGRRELGFTARTWSAVSAALALRGRGELWLGWWHYHPHFCRRCDGAARRACALSQPFFSRDDCELHRTVFDAAYCVALLVSDVGEPALRRDWFGWRHGAIEPRGCYVLGPARAGHPGPDAPAHPARVSDLREAPHEH